MTAVTFTDGEVASAAKFNAIAVAADNAQTAADGMAASAAAAAASAAAALASQGTAGGFSVAATNSAAAAAASATAAAAQVPAANNSIGRNKLHNPLFIIGQRGAGPWTTAGYGLDRWINTMNHSNGSATVTQISLPDASRAAIGDEEAQKALNYVFTGGTGAGDYDGMTQRIEDVRRLAGKTITVSFWSNAAATMNVGISLAQVFGTGGSPSAAVNVPGQVVTVSPTWARYTATFNIPSIAGKTLGSNGDSETEVTIWFSSGSNNNPRSGSVGVQSGQINLWGVQLEVGSVATALEKMDYQAEVARCQRFYWPYQAVFEGYAAGAFSVGYSIPYPSLMRAAPVAGLGVAANVNITSLSFTPIVGGIAVQAATAAAGGFVINQVVGFSADL